MPLNLWTQENCQKTIIKKKKKKARFEKKQIDLFLYDYDYPQNRERQVPSYFITCPTPTLKKEKNLKNIWAWKK